MYNGTRGIEVYNGKAELRFEELKIEQQSTSRIFLLLSRVARGLKVVSLLFALDSVCLPVRLLLTYV